VYAEKFKKSYATSISLNFWWKI